MNRHLDLSPPSRLPWLPQQLSSLCRNTGLPGLRLRPDEIAITPAIPKQDPNCYGRGCRPLPVTYTTRRGAIFIYPASTEVEAWQSQVTPAELNRLAGTSASKTAITEGQHSRRKRLQEQLTLIGSLKQNLAFPQTWLSPGRETVPALAIQQGLSVAEMLRDVRRKDSHISSSKVFPYCGFTYIPLRRDKGGYPSNGNDYPWRHTRKNSERKTKSRGSGNRNNPAHWEFSLNWRNQSSVDYPLLNRIPRIEINSSNSYGDESTRLLSRSSLASGSISFMEGKWGASSVDNDEFALKSMKTDDESEWTYQSSDLSQSIQSPRSNRPKPSLRYATTSYAQSSRSTRMMKPNVPYHHAQVNMNAVCPESAVPRQELNSSAANQDQSPSVNTGNTTTATTCVSGRWSRVTPNAGFQPVSPNRTTPASTPSTKAMLVHMGLLETAKLLLSESSKLEPVLIARDPASKQMVAEQMIGGGDAGAERLETERSSNHRERRRQREAVELQKQINALGVTIERLYQRTKEKAAVLNHVAQETLQQIRAISSQREAERWARMRRKRQLTRQLFLRHFRDRQARRKRLRVKFGVQTGRTNLTGGQLSSIPSTLRAKEPDERDALKKWEADEDLRDEAENVLAMKLEEEANIKATSRLRWLKEVTNTQLKHLEEFLTVNQPTDDVDVGNQLPASNPEGQLLQLRAKHCRLVTLLQKYGISTDDEQDQHSSKSSQQMGNESHLPATIALRNLWSDLEQENLYKMQRQAISEFERSINRGHRSLAACSRMSPTSKRRQAWRRESIMLEQYGAMVSRRTFSYFDFWPLPPTESTDEESDERQEEIRKLVKLPQLPDRKKESEKPLKQSANTPKKSVKKNTAKPKPMHYNLKAY
ncbi:hypothetical protein PHET_03948 [Paragonimus heterotremus]|uniref:Uncharacterized protein n=1 Tax=Paragonimus heterotremus TaxID=100268 RepID=A0A8J4WIX4_9TREM|nr:hypothetical protein PHET_03948 [Paragonimus heterotremus]